jgi:hypothetical protein
VIKKFLPYFLIVLFLAWAGYRFFITRDIEKAKREGHSLALDWDQLDATSGNTVKETPATIKTSAATSSEKVFKASVAQDEQFEAFDKVEGVWLGRVEKIIGPENFPRYTQMRFSNEKEKLKAYQDYHAFLRKKYGDKFTYNISEDQGIQEKKINQKYLKELRALIGDAKFKAYIKARDEINEQSRKEETNHLQIEF